MLILHDADVAFIAEDGFVEQPRSCFTPAIIAGITLWMMSGKKSNQRQIGFLTFLFTNYYLN